MPGAGADSRCSRRPRTRMRGASPGPSQSTGRAISSPSRSRSTISATTIAGRTPWRASTLRPRTIAPSVSRSLSSSLQRALVLALDAEGAGDVALGDAFRRSAAAAPPLAIKATTSSREGKAPATRAVRERGLARAAVLDGLLAGNFWVWRWGGGKRSLTPIYDRRPALTSEAVGRRPPSLTAPRRACRSPAG